MKFYAIYDLVGIRIGDEYPWCETIFLNGVATEDEEAYNACKQKIIVDYQKSLSINDVRFIGDGAYISGSVYVDGNYGVRIERLADHWHLIASQECNEWLVILIQLALLDNNHTLIHAAALEKNEEVLLLPSWGGVGKTATVCKFVRDYGWRLLGDDLVIIGDNCVIPFLKPFVIYPYHKDLFPELFKSNENHTVKNLKISNMMSKIIPGVKRMLRPFPRVLAYLRKHNPQSMRVLPTKIFTQDQISQGGTPKNVIWLERSMNNSVDCHKVSPDIIASKAVTVSSVELFAEKLDAVYHMCGCGIITYDDTIKKMHQIIYSVAQNAECGTIEIPTTNSITEIGNIIYDQIQTNYRG